MAIDATRPALYLVCHVGSFLAWAARHSGLSMVMVWPQHLGQPVRKAEAGEVLRGPHLVGLRVAVVHLFSYADHRPAMNRNTQPATMQASAR